jgi:hypothetical protein
LSANLQFTHSHEHKNNRSILDLLIIRKPDKIEIDIYRKPTTTDKTIIYTSNQPKEQEMAAYRFMTNRMTSLPLTTEKKSNRMPRNPFHRRKQQIPPSPHNKTEEIYTTQNPRGQDTRQKHEMGHLLNS